MLTSTGGTGGLENTMDNLVTSADTAWTAFPLKMTHKKKYKGTIVLNLGINTCTFHTSIQCYFQGTKCFQLILHLPL